MWKQSIKKKNKKKEQDNERKREREGWGGRGSEGVRISPSQHEPFLVEVKTILKLN